ncbi:MAG: DUF262 domain-containing protein [Bacteroidetes bacterium]|nr:DUF262 domain-containing protein [Bacteroidota bacterium]
MSYTDRINPISSGITTYLDDLITKKYQIPTFQREVVWEKENVKKLWDSIYKFYPLGSILIWKTPLLLQNHREIGGHEISNGGPTPTEFQYILDGQQRTTSLLTSLYGGTIEGRDGFDPTIYLDLTIEFEDEVDDESYKKRFLFWDEIDDKDGSYRANIGTKKRFDDGLIFKLLDISKNFNSVEKRLVQNENEDYKDYDHPIRQQLRKIKEVLDNYRVSFIELKGIQVSEVCQIFERINQAGKPLNIFDIVVAKTYKPGTKKEGGFYLRDLIQDYRDSQKDVNHSKFLSIDDLDYLQILAVIINNNITDSGVNNITDRYLNNIKTEQILEVWEDAKNAISKTFAFFEQHLHLRVPNLIPFRYFYMTIANYFFKNESLNYEVLKRYFWFNSFHNEDLLANTTQMKKHISSLNDLEQNGDYKFEKFMIDKNNLRKSSYSSKGRLSRAILSLLANQEPKDWQYPDRNVHVDNIFFSTDKPNLHHVFPTNSEYILTNKHVNSIDSNSLMNIAYLTQLTNINISNKNPLRYLRDYDQQDFEKILEKQLMPPEILQWAREEKMPANALDVFVEKRIELFINALKEKLQLPEEKFETIDTK